MKLEQEIQQEKFKDPEHKLTVNLIFTYYWLVNKLKEELKPYEVSMQQYNILRILRGQGNHPATINLLKERMLDRSSDASRLVERLRVKGWVERVICAADRRAVEIRITAQGLDLLKKIDDDDQQNANLFNALSPVQIDALNDLLDTMRG
jgi:DNA-binding MarR family transcriptional regulator